MGTRADEPLVLQDIQTDTREGHTLILTKVAVENARSVLYEKSLPRI